ncbi:hypothetical protein ABEY46_19410 [Bacillus velezensis]|uniref:hypothetical protein n=1 Tax=Bacillus velezensis TaxID=492670 RepID=UPI002DB66E14|nr:hypothetical protein [Bacillus velezensis]MEC3796969.1 hypothetical protein [Bacillus velezensis]MED4526339.1 hypothetical protein [Bacillus velezensis]
MALKGECLSADITPLEKGKEYFLFPLGESHFYVSKFNNVNAHCGAYQKKLFRITDADHSEAPEPNEWHQMSLF